MRASGTTSRSLPRSCPLQTHPACIGTACKEEIECQTREMGGGVSDVKSMHRIFWDGLLPCIGHSITLIQASHEVN